MIKFEKINVDNIFLIKSKVNVWNFYIVTSNYLLNLISEILFSLYLYWRSIKVIQKIMNQLICIIKSKNKNKNRNKISFTPKLFILIFSIKTKIITKLKKS